MLLQRARSDNAAVGQVKIDDWGQTDVTGVPQRAPDEDVGNAEFAEHF
jgi:hypothetical protein